MKTLYNETHQTRNREPTAYENLLGDAIEHAFGSGVTELADLVTALNNSGPQPQSRDTLWTEATLAAELSRLNREA
jgi:hypothetical protein